MIDDMKEYLKGYPENQRVNYLREYIQLLILKSISESGYKNNITFTGGTALRIIYKINRFSEDLDFSLTKREKYSFDQLLQKIKYDLEKYNMSFEIMKIKNEIVNSCFIRFNHLFYALDLSQNQKQKLSIKIEIDTNPPRGSEIKEFIFYERFYFLINHFSLESLFALKLHAFLFRKYNKGRDYYDMMYFLNKKIKFNFPLFLNAVKQTHPNELFNDPNEVLNAIERKINNMDEKKIRVELTPFLLKPEELNLITKKQLLLFLNQYQQ